MKRDCTLNNSSKRNAFQLLNLPWVMRENMSFLVTSKSPHVFLKSWKHRTGLFQGAPIWANLRSNASDRYKSLYLYNKDCRFWQRYVSLYTLHNTKLLWKIIRFAQSNCIFLLVCRVFFGVSDHSLQSEFYEQYVPHTACLWSPRRFALWWFLLVYPAIQNTVKTVKYLLTILTSIHERKFIEMIKWYKIRKEKRLIKSQIV